MGRPSDIFQEIELEGGKLTKVRIGGHAVTVMEGSLRGLTSRSLVCATHLHSDDRAH